MPSQMRDRSAREIALTYLEHCPRTCEEIRRRLRRARAPEPEIEEIVGGLERAGLLDDRLYAQQWVISRASQKGYGRERLGSELRLKGVAPALIDEALAQSEPESEYDAALKAATKRLGAADLREPSVKRRLAGFLQRRGHNWDTIAKVMEQLTANDG